MYDAVPFDLSVSLATYILTGDCSGLAETVIAKTNKLTASVVADFGGSGHWTEVIPARDRFMKCECLGVVSECARLEYRFPALEPPQPHLSQNTPAPLGQAQAPAYAMEGYQ